jgi:histidinol-phosphate aminotransferase
MTTIKFKRLNIEAYKPGKSSIKKLKNITKLSANESALGVSTRVKKIISNKNLNLFRYPDGKSKELRNQISKKFRCNKEKIICGAGSDEVIQMLCQLFLKPKDEVIVPQFSFLMYRIYAKIVGSNVIFAKEKKFKVSIPEIIKKVTKKTKIVFLANPNNPTGTYVSKKDLLFLRKKLRSNILLVVDDAYFEYVKEKDYSSALKLFSNYKNVIMTRTFSKIYGLAGLRVGWGYGSKEIINTLNKIKPPFNVNKAALFSASAAVKDSIWLRKEIKHVNNWNKKMFNEFKQMKIETNKSYSNFLLVNFNKVKINSSKVFKLLAEAGILVRKMDVYGIKNSLRITIGKSEENRKLIFKMKRILNV